MPPKKKMAKKKGARFAKSPLLIRAGYERVGGNYGRYNKGGELKYHDVNKTQVTVPILGVVNDSLNLIAQGTTERTRIGRKATVKSIHLKLTYGHNNASAMAESSSPVYRILVVLDKQANGAATTRAEVLKDTSVISWRNLNNSRRFTILLDKTFNIAQFISGDGTDLATSQGIKYFEWHKKCNIEIEWSGTDGLIGEVRSNNLFIIQQSSIHDDIVTSDYHIRLRYEDN